MSEIEKLLQVMKSLRDPDSGCAWDLKQDFASIAPYTIEEAYEVADAIAREDVSDLRDELGDLLFQVVFHAQMADETGLFDFADVARAINEKMVRRHPHVFGTEEERTQTPSPGAWEQIKKAERRAHAGDGDQSALAGIPVSLPALSKAEKLGKRASSVGFDWPDTQGVRAKIAEEMSEVSAAECSGNPADVQEEMGDLLFAVVNLARHLSVNPEQALAEANAKFERRFRMMEADAMDTRTDFSKLDIDALEIRWQAAKQKTKREA